MQPDEVIVILRDQTDTLISSIPDYQLKFTAALSVILGWLISSSEARDFIAIHADYSKPAIVIMLLVLAFVQSIWIIHHYKQAESSYFDLRRYIETHELFDPNLLRPQFLGKHIVPTYIVSNVLMLVAIGGVAVFS